MKRKFTKLTIEVYQNNKLVNTLEGDKDRIEEEMIQDLLAVHFFKNGRVTEVNNYDKIKITYKENVSGQNFKTVRIYE